MQVLNYEIIKKDLSDIISNIKAEYKTGQISTLGGKERPSLILRISKDKKEDWENGIYHNSRYYIIHIDYEGRLECFSHGLDTNKIRKKTVKDIKQALEYINAKI